MIKLFAFCVSMLMMGAAYAMENQDAPMPEPNYVGIIIFLVLFFGSIGWYVRRFLTQDKRDQQSKLDHAK